MKRAFMLLVAVFVCLAPLAAQIEVVSPNGNETLVLGEPWPIDWTANNITQQVRIVLLKEGGVKFGVIKEPLLPGASPWPWTIGQTDVGIAPPGKYKIRVTTLNGNNLDVSDKLFTIAGGQPPGGPPSIVVTSPNGDEPWVKLSTKNITWTAVNFDGVVDLILKQNDIVIGTIVAKLPAKQGSHPWPVGNLLGGKTAGLGRGYKVRVVKNYEGLYRPKGTSELADESDSAFSIENAYSAPIPEALKIDVTAPTEGQEFEYGREILEGNRYATVKCRWTSSKSGPFKFFLREEGNIKEKEMKAVSGPVNLGNNTYEAEFRLSRKANFTTPGLWYKIHVDAGGFFKGYSGKFKLKYKLHEVTLMPQIDDRHKHRSEIDKTLGVPFDRGNPVDPKKPGWVRVGFRNYLYTDVYHGNAYRSKVFFDLSQFKDLRGTFKSALVSYEGREFIHSANIDLADCDVQVYILANPWPGGDFLAIPGSIIQNYPQGAAKNFDISDWCENWKRGTHPNHGMLFIGKNEKFNHDNLFGVSYYKIRLKVRFVED